MTSPDRTLITVHGALPRAEYTRIDASAPSFTPADLDDLNELDSVCVVLASDLDDDTGREDLVALVSVLVARGVTAFDTVNPRIVQRIVDTYAAISTGQIEVLEQ